MESSGGSRPPLITAQWQVESGTAWRAPSSQQACPLGFAGVFIVLPAWLSAAIVIGMTDEDITCVCTGDEAMPIAAIGDTPTGAAATVCITSISHASTAIARRRGERAMRCRENLIV